MVPTAGKATSSHRVPRGGRSIVLGVALMLTAQSLHNWRAEPTATPPPAKAVSAPGSSPAADTPPPAHKPN